MVRMPEITNELGIEEQLIKITEKTKSTYELVMNSKVEEDIEESCMGLLQEALNLVHSLAKDNSAKFRMFLRHELKMKCQESNERIRVKNWIEIRFNDD